MPIKVSTLKMSSVSHDRCLYAPQIMNDIFKFRKIYTIKYFRTKRYGLECTAYRASQIWQIFPLK